MIARLMSSDDGGSSSRFRVAFYVGTSNERRRSLVHGQNQPESCLLLRVAARFMARVLRCDPCRRRCGLTDEGDLCTGGVAEDWRSECLRVSAPFGGVATSRGRGLLGQVRKVKMLAADNRDLQLAVAIVVGACQLSGGVASGGCTGH